MLKSLLLISSLSASYAFAASSPPSKLQLKYFDIQGAAETSRVLLALGQEDYDDARYKIDPATFQSPDFLGKLFYLFLVCHCQFRVAPSLTPPSPFSNTRGQGKWRSEDEPESCTCVGHS